MAEFRAPTPERVLRSYFHAKDENRPHLLEQVFSPDATLEVHNSSDAISFPARTVGREAIAEVLVRRFAQAYENVYSFYMSRPTGTVPAFRCDWLVCMSEKDGRNVRVGCGRYDWAFEATPPRLASGLVITIRAMQVLPPHDWAPTVAWIRGLQYPWTSAGSVLASAPTIDGLAPVLRYLGRRDEASGPVG